MSESMELEAILAARLADARADIARNARGLIRTYVAAECLDAVYAVYGEQPYDGTDLEGQLDHAEKFGNQHLDFRQGKPRSRQAIELPERRAHALHMLGEEVGMLGACSLLGMHVNAVLMHGTYREGLLQRVRLAREHVDAHEDKYHYRPHRILGLSIERPLTDEDAQAEIMYATEATTERQLMDSAIEREFRVYPTRQPSHQPNIRYFKFVTYDNDYVVSLSAPRVEGSRLPNTADTQRYAAEVAGMTTVGAGMRALGTTASVYAGFQQLDLMRTWGLPYGVDVHMASYFDPAWTQPAHIGQEVNSVFDQGTRMLHAIKEYEAQQPSSGTVTIDLGK